MKTKLIYGVGIICTIIFLIIACYAEESLDIYLDDILSCNGTWECVSLEEYSCLTVRQEHFLNGNDQGEVFCFTLTCISPIDNGQQCIQFVYFDDTGTPLLELHYCLLINEHNNIQVSMMELGRYFDYVDDAY